MFGLSSGNKDAIGNIVENLFDTLAMQFLGDIPRLRNKKLLVFSAKSNYNLAHLFLQSMSNDVPNHLEQDTLKGILESSYGYLDALKSRTRASLTEQIDALAKEAKIQERELVAEDVKQVISDELSKARSNLQTIVESEGTKVRNVGMALKIAKVAESIDDNDPNVAFICVHDNVLCGECRRLHLADDGISPRVWRLSELKYGYHKRGEDKPSVNGLHPNDRCVLTYLTRGFGYDKKGKLAYKGMDHDEWAEQRE